MKLRAPRTLKGQFTLALGTMAFLVLAGGALAIGALLDFAERTHLQTQAQLAYVLDAQALLDHTRHVQLYAAHALGHEATDDPELGHTAIVNRLNDLDRLTARLAVAEDTSVLDLHHWSQLFRASAQVVAQLRDQPDEDAGDAASRHRLRLAVSPMQLYARRMVEAAQRNLAAHSAAHRASADELRQASRRHALWAAVLLTSSLGAALLIVQLLLGRHVVARLRRVSEALRRLDESAMDAATTPVSVAVGGSDEIALMARSVEQSARDRRQHASTQLQLEEGNRRLAAVLDNTADAILVLHDGRVSQWNRAAQNLLGADEHALEGCQATQFMDAGVLDTALHEVNLALDTRFHRLDGSPVEVELAISQVASREGQLVILVARDATLRREAERHLRHARDAAEAARASQSAFLTAMSHELRTPLHGILGYTQLLKLGGQLDAKSAEQVGVIERSGQHLLELITDLLDLARHEAGRLTLDLQPCAVTELVDMVCDIVRVKADEAGLAFAASVAPDVPAQVVADARRLRQVLLNLLGNAVKFTERGSVRLAVTRLPSRPGREGAGLHFEISDTGIGLSPQQIQTLFEPFEQFGDAKRRAAGSGLGLAISRQLVRLMGGEISVTSKPGRRTCFAFDLPLGPACAPGAMSTGQAKAAGQGRAETHGSD